MTDVPHSQTLLRECRHARQVQSQPLVRNFKSHRSGQQPDRLFHQRDRNRLAGATMGDRSVAAAMRHEIELLCLPAYVAIQRERVRCRKSPRIVIGTVEIENHPIALLNSVALPLERVAGYAADEWKEGIKPHHLFSECFKLGLISGRETIRPLPLSVQCHRGEDDVTAGRDHRPQDVDDLDRRVGYLKQISVLVPMLGNDADRSAFPERKGA